MELLSLMYVQKLEQNLQTYNNFDMIALILVSPIVFLVCYAVPLLATFLSRQQSDKWVAFWLLQIVASWTLIPFFSLFFECEVQMLLKAVFALALFFLLNGDKVSQIHSGVESVVGVVNEQKKNATQRVSSVAKEYGLME